MFLNKLKTIIKPRTALSNMNTSLGGIRAYQAPSYIPSPKLNNYQGIIRKFSRGDILQQESQRLLEEIDELNLSQVELKEALENFSKLSKLEQEYKNNPQQEQARNLSNVSNPFYSNCGLIYTQKIIEIADKDDYHLYLRLMGLDKDQRMALNGLRDNRVSIKAQNIFMRSKYSQINMLLAALGGYLLVTYFKVDVGGRLNQLLMDTELKEQLSQFNKLKKIQDGQNSEPISNEDIKTRFSDVLVSISCPSYRTSKTI